MVNSNEDEPKIPKLKKNHEHHARPNPRTSLLLRSPGRSCGTIGSLYSIALQDSSSSIGRRRIWRYGSDLRPGLSQDGGYRGGGVYTVFHVVRVMSSGSSVECFLLAQIPDLWGLSSHGLDAEAGPGGVGG